MVSMVNQGRESIEHFSYNHYMELQMQVSNVDVDFEEFLIEALEDRFEMKAKS